MTFSLFNFTQSGAHAIVGWRGGVPVRRDEFLLRVSDWTALLSSLPGQNYALFIDDSIEFCAALFGAWQSKKTVWLSADTLESSCEALKSTVDGFIGEFPDAYQPIGDRLGFQKNDPLSVGADVQLNQLDESFIALVVHTSGTTGAPQSIPKRLSQLTAEVKTLEHLFGNRCAHAEFVSTVAHHHIYGLLFKVLWPIAFGRPFHAQTLTYPEEIEQLLLTHTCILISSPAYLKRLPDHLNWTKNHVQTIFSSGGLLPADVAKSCSLLLGKMPVEVYGSSETGGVAWRERDDLSDDSWQAMPQVNWRVSPDDNLIEIRSPHLFTDDWLKTSDQGQETTEGRFLLAGRQDRIVKIEEKRVSIEAVERTLSASTLVSEVKMLFVSDNQTTTRRQHLIAVVVLSPSGKQFLEKNGKLALNKQLAAELKNQVEPVAIPRRWRYVDQFPVSEQGKTTIKMLQALFLDELIKKSLAPVISLRSRDAHQARFDVYWPDDFTCFEGHFPDAPVLPGVAQVHWAIKIARQIFDLPTSFRAMRALKFQHIILPDSTTTLSLNYDPKKDSLSFSYFSTGKQFSSGSIYFGQKQEGVAGA